MTRKEIDRLADKTAATILTMDGYDDCIAGISYSRMKAKHSNMEIETSQTF